MPARKTPQGLQVHPQVRAITEAILKGETLASVRKWATPRPSIAALSHFKCRVLAPAMQQAEALKAVMPESIKRAQGISPMHQPDGCKQPDCAPNNDVQVAQVVTDAIAAAPLIAVREKRIEELEDRRRRMRLIIEERGVEMAGECAGGASGLLARDYKGKDATTPVYKVDTGLLSELREHEKQAAQELGQWQDSAGPQVAIQIVYPSSPGAGRDMPFATIGLPKR
ncbi:MAG: hypothetical protein ABFD89_28820 [Bryobacteraceae bacterium]